MNANQERQIVIKEVHVTHHLMTQTLGQNRIKRLQDNCSRDVLSSMNKFDTMITNMEWNDGQIDVFQSVMKDVRFFFSWKGGVKNKSKKIDREEATTLVAKLRSMLFESVAIVYQIPNMQSSEAC